MLRVYFLLLDSNGNTEILFDGAELCQSIGPLYGDVHCTDTIPKSEPAGEDL